MLKNYKNGFFSLGFNVIMACRQKAEINNGYKLIILFFQILSVEKVRTKIRKFKS